MEALLRTIFALALRRGLRPGAREVIKGSLVMRLLFDPYRRPTALLVDGTYDTAASLPRSQQTFSDESRERHRHRPASETMADTAWKE